ncbi:FAD-binding protein [Frankia sp. R82]|uniref:FAD-dependent oxidoreductase n=1 Tax=Frankia sp. R82 TaxID=2950553 RepID=UPI0020444101|nr:FAD-binding protein [Frankia sp. R82]MCM3887561.1 FAD-binding protein [Frankia sp. R82]
MSGLSRRHLLAGFGGGVATVGARPLLVGSATAAPAPSGSDTQALQPPDQVSIGPSDRRYPDALQRGFNRRFVGSPESVRIVSTTAQVVAAVQEAVRSGKKIVVRSGGHCLENFVDDPAAKIVIDLVEMRSVTFDASRKAFAVEAGVTLGELYRALDWGWGVTVPGGSCQTVGIGGHATGGGFGMLSRQHGIVADYIDAVEVVIVGANGVARAVVATGAQDDPNRELWWAHTGGGGGNFGVVTRFWLRSRSATTSDPTSLLPTPPRALANTVLTWSWSDLGRADFVRLLGNYGTWHELNSAPGSAGAKLFSALTAGRKEFGSVSVLAQVDPTDTAANGVVSSYLSAIRSGVAAVPTVFSSGNLPWLTTVLNLPTTAAVYAISGPLRSKSKGALLKKGYTGAQLDAVYDNLTSTGYNNPASALSLLSYGGAINATAPTATATAHRSSVIAASFTSYWENPADDDANIAWLRRLYSAVYADTGGVPAPNAANEGSYINWPDIDLVDPTQNTSHVRWSTLFYGDNYARLQLAKAAYDPKNVFTHALGVTAP